MSHLVHVGGGCCKTGNCYSPCGKLLLWCSLLLLWWLLSWHLGHQLWWADSISSSAVVGACTSCLILDAFHLAAFSPQLWDKIRECPGDKARYMHGQWNSYKVSSDSCRWLYWSWFLHFRIVVCMIVNSLLSQVIPQIPNLLWEHISDWLLRTMLIQYINSYQLFF